MKKRIARKLESKKKFHFQKFDKGIFRDKGRLHLMYGSISVILPVAHRSNYSGRILDLFSNIPLPSRKIKIASRKNPGKARKAPR